MKVIGCGNPDRGDDSAGIEVAKRLRQAGLAAEIHTGDALGLLEKWSDGDDITLVDAVVTGARPGTLHVWECSHSAFALPKAVRDAAVSSHGFDLARAIELACTLGKLPARLRIFGIEGREFERGAAPSKEVSIAIDELVRRIQAEARVYGSAKPYD